MLIDEVEAHRGVALPRENDGDVEPGATRLRRRSAEPLVDDGATGPEAREERLPESGNQINDFLGGGLGSLQAPPAILRRIEKLTKTRPDGALVFLNERRCWTTQLGLVHLGHVNTEIDRETAKVAYA